jgi:hypothetical protein
MKAPTARATSTAADVYAARCRAERARQPVRQTQTRPAADIDLAVIEGPSYGSSSATRSTGRALWHGVYGALDRERRERAHRGDPAVDAQTVVYRQRWRQERRIQAPDARHGARADSGRRSVRSTKPTRSPAQQPAPTTSATQSRSSPTNVRLGRWRRSSGRRWRVPDVDWRLRAACRDSGLHPDTWFPNPGDLRTRETAIRICIAAAPSDSTAPSTPTKPEPHTASGEDCAATNSAASTVTNNERGANPCP